MRNVGRRTRASIAGTRQTQVGPERGGARKAHGPGIRITFLDGYSNANRLTPSGVSDKKSILGVDLILLLGDKRLDAIQTEDVQRLKSALGHRAAKTVNNVLTVLSVMLRTAVEWHAIERIPCSIRLLKTSKSVASFYDVDEYERLVEGARSDRHAYLVMLLGGEAGVRCGEMMALRWKQLGRVSRQTQTAPGRLR